MSKDAEMKALKALADYRNAKRENDSDKMDAAADKFHNVVDLVEQERGDELLTIFNALVDAQAEVVFNTYAKVAQTFGEAKTAFELGEKMAHEGKNGLFFPTAATELAKIAEALEQLKQAAEKVVNEVGDLAEPFEKKDASALIEEGQQAADGLKLLLDSLEKVKVALPD